MPRLPSFLRRFSRAPMFTATVLVTLAIGIGANTAVFSVINGVLIKPLPIPTPKNSSVSGTRRLASASITARPTSRRRCTSPIVTRAARSRTSAWSGGGVTVTGQSEPEQVRSLFVTQGVLEALRVRRSSGAGSHVRRYAGNATRRCC